MGRWSTQWDLTSSPLPTGYATVACSLSKQMPLLTPTDRRNQALYSTPARTPISLSFSIHAPHIMDRWNTQWDLTSSALPRECATVACSLSKQMPLLAPTDRRNQALYSTPARTPISLGSRIQASHIMGRWNTHWDLTSSAVRDSCKTAPATLFKQMPLLAPTDRRNQAVYSTSARTPISLSSRNHGPLEYALGPHLQCYAYRMRLS
eukprot:COSAG02_NODE_2273_length_9263_cov_10.296377_7_plen_207_part_00